MRGFLKSNQKQSSRRGQSGNVLVETALVISLILVPMALGVAFTGLNLIRANQANQINRDAGHMFARGVDFSGSANGLLNQAVLFKIAPALKQPNPTAVLVLTSVWYLGPLTCPAGCTNLGCVVYTRQVVLGNATDRAKANPVGTVNAAIIDTTGLVANPTGDSRAQALCGSSPIALGPLKMLDGDHAYISDTYISSADLVIPGVPNMKGVMAHAFF